jgi:biopolymer transport protein TolR
MAFGRLERTKGPEPMSQINMTPLVDVMLVLVVIFIITAPLLASSIHVDLPKADTSSANESPAAVMLVLDAQGQAYLKDQPVSREALLAQLSQTALANPATEVQLRADKRLPYGDVVEVMGQINKAGLTRIGFVADPADKANPDQTKPVR